MKLKRIVLRDVEPKKRKYMYTNPTKSIYSTTTVTIITTSITTATVKAQATSINSTATTTATVIKTKDNMAKILEYIETVWN